MRASGPTCPGLHSRWRSTSRCSSHGSTATARRTRLRSSDAHVSALLGPGFFAASVLYGILARRTGTILPGMAVHIAGDLAYMYFGVLRGDWNLSFVR